MKPDYAEADSKGDEDGKQEPAHKGGDCPEVRAAKAAPRRGCVLPLLVERSVWNFLRSKGRTRQHRARDAARGGKVERLQRLAAVVIARLGEVLHFLGCCPKSRRRARRKVRGER